MKAILSSLVLLLLLTACERAEQQQEGQQLPITEREQENAEELVIELEPQPVLDQNAEFEQFKADFLSEFWRLHPGFGVYVGYYLHDDQLLTPNGELRAQRRAFYVTELQALKQFDANRLSTANATDWKILDAELRKRIWYIDAYRSYEWNPAVYNPSGALGIMLTTDYKSIEERKTSVFNYLGKVPAYFEAAKQNIKLPTLEHTQLALLQSQGTLNLIQDQVAATFTEIEAAGEAAPSQEQFATQLQTAVEAVVDYRAYLEQLLAAPPADGWRGFRLGEELYEKKFAYDIASQYTAKELYERALIAKDELHQRMMKITEELWPTVFADVDIPENRLIAVKQVIDKLSEMHVKRADFVAEIERQIPELEAFVNDKQLLDQDPTRPLVVRLTPEYQRGIAGASVNAPGPYDATANTYYNVSPLDGYSEEQAESYLREYNHWILQILNIHEAIPGHYTQLMHANKSPSKIKSIFANGSMIEGWAVYAERLMLEAGYGDNEPQMWLMYSKWNLRVVMNTILDYRIQVLGMEREEALNLMINEAFQEQTEAENKWRRATVSQVQLTSYFNGFAEILALRDEVKALQGEAFDLKVFNNQFLSYGNAPVSVIRKLMLSQITSSVVEPVSQ